MYNDAGFYHAKRIGRAKQCTKVQNEISKAQWLTGARPVRSVCGEGDSLDTVNT